jgi:hypothetical protein
MKPAIRILLSTAPKQKWRRKLVGSGVGRSVRMDCPKPIFQKAPVDRPHQLRQRMIEVEDLIGPRVFVRFSILVSRLKTHELFSARGKVNLNTAPRGSFASAHSRPP